MELGDWAQAGPDDWALGRGCYGAFAAGLRRCPNHTNEQALLTDRLVKPWVHGAEGEG
jgi:hypothetical protein